MPSEAKSPRAYRMHITVMHRNALWPLCLNSEQIVRRRNMS
jgi:hypothetical protein